MVLAEPGWSGNAFIEGAYYEWSHDDSHGVSIYLPPIGKRPTFYKADWLDFAAGTNWTTQASANLIYMDVVTDTIEWGPMWVDYIALADPDAIDEPDPPELLAPLPVPYTVFLPVVLR